MNWPYCFGLSVLLILLPAERKKEKFLLVSIIYLSGNIMIRTDIWIHFKCNESRRMLLKPRELLGFEFFFQLQIRNHLCCCCLFTACERFPPVETSSDILMCKLLILLIILQLRGAVTQRHVSRMCLFTAHAGRCVYTNISIATVVDPGLPKRKITSAAAHF